MSFDSGWTHAPGFRNRFLLFSLAAIGVFLLLMLRLWYLQVIHEERYQALSERNRIRYIPVAAPRGPIYDRDGLLLVDTRPSFRISVLRQEVDEPQVLLARLADFLGVEPELLRRRWDQGGRQHRFRPLPRAEDVDLDVLERVHEIGVLLPGVLAEVRPLRSYIDQEMAAHLFGYLGEITEAELQSSRFDGYGPGDFIGKSGLEKVLEEYLRGSAGERRVEVDVLGKELRILKTQEPRPGNRVFLTLQRDLQLAAEAAFGEHAGSAAVIDVHTGEVLALVSRPSFNPAVFARGITGKEWIDLLQNSRHPLQNKVITGQYPPGSTFKIVTALAALRAGIATAATSHFCSGSIHLGSHEFRCWKKGGHGSVDLKRAMKESCDVWFYRVGLELGIDRLAQAARDLGLGEPVGFALEGEKGGLIPDRQWKRRRFGEPWYDGETVIAAIGQGYVLNTPLQLAVMTAAVANGGKVLRPYVVRRVEDNAGKVLLEPGPQVLKTAGFSQADLLAVRRTMESVLHERGGTAWTSRLEEVRVGGKTGTAQVVKLPEDRNKGREIPYRFRDHALFVAFAPAENPQIAVSVVVEHGGSGSAVAAPIARAIFASYFGLVPKVRQEEFIYAGD